MARGRLGHNGRMRRFFPLSECRRPPLRWVGLLVLLGLAGCRSVAYYAHVGHGQWQLLSARRPVAQVVADPATPPALSDRLRQAERARQFASDHLGLPDNRSYTYYVALPRPYVVWNVFATPRFSLSPVQHCFPIAGCVAYRGYFSQSLAQREAARLQAAGDDVYVSGVSAYSTLGWFADPILSSMLRWDDDELDSTIFHELAHQLIYVKGDTAFNESFASFVQQQGLNQWRQSRGLPPTDGRADAMERGFTALVLALREELRQLYAQPLDEAAMARGKQQAIAAFRQKYARWRDQHWPGQHDYDAWVQAPIDNAKLLPFGLYDGWTPAFARLFARAEGQWPAFYASVRTLARLPKPEREARLRGLMPAAAASSSAP